MLLWTKVGNLSQVKRLVEEKEVDPLFSEENGAPALHTACYSGHLEIVKYFVEERNCNIDSRDKCGNAPLHYAAHSGKLHIVKYIINDRVCDPICRGKNGWTSLHSACKSDSLELVKYLIEEKKVSTSFQAEGGAIPLHIAAEHGTLDIVKYLVQECGIDCKDNFENTPLHYAAISGKFEIFQYLINQKGCDPLYANSLGWTPLHFACRFGKLAVVKYLLEEKKVDFSHQSGNSNSPLHLAAQFGTLDTVKYLVERHGCDVESRTADDYTLIHCAAMGGKLDIVKYLVNERGCDPQYKSKKDGFSPLYCACSYGHLNVVQYLIGDIKIDTSYQDEGGHTLLHLAAVFGHQPIVKFLVEECQCDPTIEDINSRTPAMYAKFMDHAEIALYLSSIVQREAQLKPYTRKAKPTGIVLGRGTYGKVIEVMSAGEILAGKIFNVSAIGQSTSNSMNAEIITMMQLSHPNVVQCKGVCYFPDKSPMPVLLMERLMTSLHAYLLNTDNPNLSLRRKVLFLLDTANGLDYLHSRIPAIIHRDLTARNVLLDSQLRAKIADFSNSRILDLDPNATPGTLTSLPGTLDYMPPETMGGCVTYDPSMDVFSFGHLALFTLIQTHVMPLLPPTYTNSIRKLVARSEVERRMQFVEVAKKIPGSHSLLPLVQQCLRNEPSQRPGTGKLVELLRNIVTAAGEWCTYYVVQLLCCSSRSCYNE